MCRVGHVRSCDHRALRNHAFRQRGFNVVQVVLPEQELNQGVVETKIGQVRIEGNS
jgi:hemolysin activation/secretion protein